MTTSPLLDATGVTKNYGAVAALRNASLSVLPGEVHALMGANGAGKSTLVKILTGAIPANSGRILIRGEAHDIRSPAAARRAGLLPVYQEPSLIPDLDVLSNLRLTGTPVEPFRAWVRELGILDLDLRDTARDIPLAVLRVLDLARALAVEPDVLLLDEMTAALPANLAEKVLEVVRRQGDAGRAVIFISHRFVEISALCDRATVLRDGETVGVVDIVPGVEEKIVELMLGTRIVKTHVAARSAEQKAAPAPARPRIAVRNLRVGTKLSDVSFDLADGEVAGVVALEGQGQDELFAALSGSIRPSGGTIEVDGSQVKFSHPIDAIRAGISPALVGTFKLPDGRPARPSFALIAERFLSDEYSPETVAAATAIPAETIRRIARELAHAAFEQQVTLDVPWTDTDGRRHEKTVGRPVSMHAMRGISAHSNGFQTCRMLHLLQIVLGSIDCPGGFRYKAPFPRPTPPPNRPARPSQPNTPLKGAPLGFPQGPEDLLVDADGKPQRIDKAYSWDAPLAAHGLMHMVITNAATADPYPVDVLFMYMANMSWNSSMNIPAVLRHLTATDEKTGEYKIPKIIYSDAYSSEMIVYADLILPDTTYLERWDCISLLDRPISGPDAPADAIRQPVVEPDRDVRPFQTVLLDLGARLGLPGFVTDTGSPRYPGGYPDYIVNHERSPGIGSLAGFRGADGNSYGRGAPNPKQLESYIAGGCFHEHHLAPEQRYYKHANKAYLDWAKDVGFIGAAAPIIFQLYLEPLQKFRQAARGHGAVTAPATHRTRIEKYFDPIPFWYPPFDGAPSDGETFSAITQRPMHIYHSWGTHNGWIRQITAENCLYMNRARAQKLGIADGDWVWIKSAIGRVKGRVRLMEGVNPDTVWTWNAIGRRAGAAALDNDAPESTRGFLLNHLITELLPEREGGYRFSNSDPITGQAAWYDLRVSIEKAAPDEVGETWPQFVPLHSPPLARAEVTA